MKINLTCYYGANNPGDVIDVDETEGKRLVLVGAGFALKEEISSPATKPKVGK